MNFIKKIELKYLLRFTSLYILLFILSSVIIQLNSPAINISVLLNPLENKFLYITILLTALISPFIEELIFRIWVINSKILSFTSLVTISLLLINEVIAYFFEESVIANISLYFLRLFNGYSLKPDLNSLEYIIQFISIEDFLRLLIFLLSLLMIILTDKYIKLKFIFSEKSYFLYAFSTIVFALLHNQVFTDSYLYIIHYILLSIWFISIIKSKGIFTAMLAHSLFNLTLIMVNIYKYYYSYGLFKELVILMVFWVVVLFSFIISYFNINLKKKFNHIINIFKS